MSIVRKFLSRVSFSDRAILKRAYALWAGPTHVALTPTTVLDLCDK